MAYKYKHFIPQNTAPSGATSIKVYDGNKEICTIPLGRMTPPTGTKRYSFGLVSDIHLWSSDSSAYGYSNSKFQNALSYFEDKEKGDCGFCIVCGDITVTGLHTSIDDTIANAQFDDGQFSAYETICKDCTIPVYELMGNHESYYSRPVTKNLSEMGKYSCNNKLFYTIEQGNDLYIFLGQPEGEVVMVDDNYINGNGNYINSSDDRKELNDDYGALKTLLSNSQDKRCFVFVHSYIAGNSDRYKDYKNDSGNPLNNHEYPLFDSWGHTNEFVNELAKYDNVVLFHGHSHIHFSTQEQVKHAIYSHNLGFHSVHVPSLANGRKIVQEDGKYKLEKKNTQYSLGYLVDVYDDCIVLNGIDFTTNSPVPIGTYKIDISTK